MNNLFNIILSKRKKNATDDSMVSFDTEQIEKNVWRIKMDRRQRRTREAIFRAFTKLLTEKSFDKLTVGEIIACADVGRATFYAHFETKEFLLKELCEELFCHIFDSVCVPPEEHRHIFSCEEQGSVFLHLLKHLEKNDNNVLKLLVGRNNELFLEYFKNNLKELVKSQLPLFSHQKSSALPEDFLINHITATFVETVRWWAANGRKESPETVAEYFFLAV